MSTQQIEWTPVGTASPEAGTLVEVITPDGDQRDLYYDKSGLWFLPDRSMYVYFTPAFWRAKEWRP